MRKEVKKEICSSALEGGFLAKGFRFVAGVDEAGRGPLAGPVVAAAVSPACFESRLDTDDRKLWPLVRDSKTLSASQRERVFAFINGRYIVGIGFASVEAIDRLNILEAAFLAMKEAIGEWKRRAREHFGESFADDQTMFLVDGGMEIPHAAFRQEAIKRGDAIVSSIAAASIVAKVTRDREMLELAREYPEYGFERHKGYGTREHLEALRRLGPVSAHRRSFAPVRRVLRELRSYGASV